MRVRRWACYLFAIATALGTLLALNAATVEPPFVVLVLPILASAYIGRLGPGLVATAVAACGAWVVFPQRVAHSHDVKALALVVVGSAVSSLIEALHRSRAEAQTNMRDSHHSRALFAHGFANNPSPMSLSRLDDATVVEINAAYTSLFNVGKDVIGHRPSDAGLVIENIDREAAFADLRTRGSMIARHMRVRTPRGATKHVNVTSQVIEMDGVQYALTTFVDITDQTNAEAAALESAAMFRELAEAIHEVFWLTNVENTKIYYVSPAYERIFGRPTSALYADSHDWMRTLHPDDLARMRNFATTKAEAVRNERYRIQHPDGTWRTIRVAAFPVRDARGEVVRMAGIGEDITERVLLEEQVRQTQKLESLGLLAGGVAHDFNNILAVINANVGLLSEREMPADDRELVGDIETAVVRATALTRQLLAFSRKQVSEPIVLDLNAAIADTRKMLRRMVGEDIVIATSLEPDLANVKIDPGSLVQILMNLVVNARDAMPRGGTLTITTRRLGDLSVLSVADSGCGMSPEVISHVFEPLFTTKGLGKGTGLGLSVVQSIVEHAGGRILVDSELGKGSTFEIHFPSVDAPAERITDVVAAAAHGNERILVVDDDFHVRTSASRALRSRGYTVHEAGDGKAALAVLCDQGIDLLVTDVVMPGMDGRELAEAAVDLKPDLKVLYTSGYADDAVVRHGVEQDKVDFLEKPFRIHALAAKVRQVLDAA